jgi:O-antigen/teichoic acid export membrane protein
MANIKSYFDLLSSTWFLRVAEVFLSRLAGAGIQFLFLLLLAQVIGVEGFGVFSFGYALLLIASAVSRWGMDQYALRQLSLLRDASGYGQTAQSVFSQGIVIVAFFAICSSLVLFVLTYLLAPFFVSVQNHPYVLMILMLGIVPVSLTYYLGECLRALNRQVVATLLQTTAVPALMSAYLIMSDTTRTGVVQVVSVYVVCSILVCLGAFIFWFSLHSIKMKWYALSIGTMAVTAVQVRSLAMLTIMLTWLGLSEVMLLGVLVGSESVAAYSASMRLFFLFGFVILAINNVLSPKFVVLYRERAYPQLTKLIKQASYLGFLLSFPIFLLVMMWPDVALGLFGVYSDESILAMQIMAVGQLLLCSLGTRGTVLIMIGQEGVYRRIITFTLAMNLILGLLLIDRWSLVGAAISSVLTIGLTNAMCYLSVKKALALQ